MKVTLKTLTDKLYPIEIEATNTIDQLKNKVRVATGIPEVHIRLIHKGRGLIDNEMVSTYGIEEGSIIHMVLRFASLSIRQVVSETNGVVISSEKRLSDCRMHLGETVLVLKKNIEEKMQIPVDKQVLKFNSVTLDNSMFLIQYGIDCNSIIDLEVI